MNYPDGIADPSYLEKRCISCRHWKVDKEEDDYFDIGTCMRLWTRSHPKVFPFWTNGLTFVTRYYDGDDCTAFQPSPEGKKFKAENEKRKASGYL